MNQEHLDVAIQAARSGAVELLSRRESRTVTEKAPKDLVTDADLASQKAIREILTDAFPDHAFVGEEEGENDPPAAVRAGKSDAPASWDVDPLDGTGERWKRRVPEWTADSHQRLQRPLERARRLQLSGRCQSRLTGGRTVHESSRTLPVAPTAGIVCTEYVLRRRGSLGWLLGN